MNFILQLPIPEEERKYIDDGVWHRVHKLNLISNRFQDLYSDPPYLEHTVVTQ